MVMAVIGTSIITAVGLMGALAIIRFRNIIKDTRDIAFIFCTLVVGMAAGSQRYAVAIVGTIILRFTVRGHIGPESPIPAILKRFCGSYTLISAQDSGFGVSEVEYAYQLMIRNAEGNQEMLSELQKVEGLENISLTMQEKLLEV